MKDEQFDSIIDAVAGGMTAGEPRRTFTAEVVARIESGSEPRRTWRAAWVLAPLAAAAAIVLVLVLVVFRGMHRSGETASPQASTSGARGVETSTAQRAETSQPEVNFSKNAAAIEVAGRGQAHDRGPARGARQTAVTGSLDEPAVQVDAIDLARLSVDSLTSDPIQIERLDSIAPITVAPLDIPDVQRRFE